MSNIAIFNFQSNHQVRIALKGNEPYFCLKDVAEVLAIQNHNEVVRNQLDPKGIAKIQITDALNRKQVATFINEPNLYRVIFRSNKKEAVKFQNWVFDEVLPSIRKTGHYTTTQAPKTTPTDLYAIKNKAYDIGDHFHFAGGARAEIYNRLRVALGLANIADIAPHQLADAHAILNELHANAKAYAAFRYELDKLAQSAIIRQGRPYTPHVKKALSQMGLMVGVNPDWNALAQVARLS